MKITWPKILYLYVKTAYLYSLKKKIFPKNSIYVIFEKMALNQITVKAEMIEMINFVSIRILESSFQKIRGSTYHYSVLLYDKAGIINDSPSSLERNVCRMEAGEFNFNGRTKPFVPLFSPSSLSHYWPLSNLYSSYDDPIVFGIDRKIGRLTKRA